MKRVRFVAFVSSFIHNLTIEKCSCKSEVIVSFVPGFVYLNMIYNAFYIIIVNVEIKAKRVYIYI